MLSLPGGQKYTKGEDECVSGMLEGQGGGCCGWDRMRWGRDGKEVTEAVRGHSPRGPKGYINPSGGLGGGDPLPAGW